MKRLIALLLATFMLFAISACRSDEAPKKEALPEEEIEVTTPGYEDDTPPSQQETPPADKPAAPPADKPATPPADKPAAPPADKPAAPPADKPAAPPADKPAAPPADKPAAPPADKPATPPADEPPAPPAPPADEPSSTVGDALLSVFRSNASKSGNDIANAVIASDAIPEELVLMTVEVEEGYLTGFDNTEIKGFESGVMFAPGMGTIPFVGYVFTLPEGADADAFASTLKGGANLRWNICTEAEQMVVEKSGNKVFFLMCPKSFEQ